LHLPTDLEEIQDQADVVGKLTPREYAQLRGMSPQLVYYYIRNKVLELEYCLCGRRVLDVNKADDNLQKKKEARSGKLDAGDTSSSVD
jgi:hypothetical protein